MKSIKGKWKLEVGEKYSAVIKNNMEDRMKKERKSKYLFHQDVEIRTTVTFNLIHANKIELMTKWKCQEKLNL